MSVLRLTQPSAICTVDIVMKQCQLNNNKKTNQYSTVFQFFSRLIKTAPRNLH